MVYILRIVVAGDLFPREDFQPPVVGGRYPRFEQASYTRGRCFAETAYGPFNKAETWRTWLAA
jgi:hypothetical protein